jgi:hypothetical protein
LDFEGNFVIRIRMHSTLCVHHFDDHVRNIAPVRAYGFAVE